MSKEYLNYLLRQRKIVLIFFFACYIGIVMIAATTAGVKEAMKSGTTAAVIMSFALTYALPVIQLSYVHRRRSVDQYFALPVSRKKQIITEILFMAAVCIGYYLVTSLGLYVTVGHITMRSLTFFRLTGVMVVSMIIMILVNSYLFLLGNNIFDGVVILMAYTCMPLLIVIVQESFGSSMVAGGARSFDGIAGYFSPLYLCAEHVVRVMNGTAETGIPAFVLVIVYAAAAGYGLYRAYVQRKTERAEQLSDNPLAYPAVINIYAAGILFGLGFSTVSGEVEYILYMVLAVIYIIAQFVYRRKLEVRRSYIITFAALLLITHAVAYAGWVTKGFGAAYRYDLCESGALHYDYNAYVDKDLSSLADDSEEGYYSKYDRAVNIRWSIDIPTAQKEKYQDLITRMEEYRKECIREFYAPGYAKKNRCGSLDVFARSNPGANDVLHPFYYSLVKPIPMELLKKMNTYSPVTISYDDADRWVELNLEEYLMQEE